MTSGDAEMNAKFNDSRLKIEIEVKIGEKMKLGRQNLEELQKIWQEKIRSIRI